MFRTHSVGVSASGRAWIDHALADHERFEYGGLLEAVSFLTLVAMIALAGLSVAAVTLLYAL